MTMISKHTKSHSKENRDTLFFFLPAVVREKNNGLCRKRDLGLALGQNLLIIMADKAVKQVAWEGSDASIMGGFEEPTRQTVDNALWK